MAWVVSVVKAVKPRAPEIYGCFWDWPEQWYFSGTLSKLKGRG